MPHGVELFQMDIKTKRVYESASNEDGVRVLVDRLWPRGISRERMKVDLWLKEVGPSTELRKWFNHDRSRWEEFKNRYFLELDRNREMVAKLRELVTKGRLTLLFSATDRECNQAVALKEYLLLTAR